MAEITRTNIYIAAAIFAFILASAGLAHLALMSRWQLYVNMKATDDKQNEYILNLENRVLNLEHKLGVFEQHMKIEAEAAQKEKTR